MSVKIRLTRTGKTHHLTFRIVACDTKTKRDGKFLEILGYYNPQHKPPKNFQIKKERYEWWLQKGAQPTLAVTQLLSGQTAKQPTIKALEKE